jgi:hypothetical protein
MDHSTEIGRKPGPAMSEFVWFPSGKTDQRSISRPISVSLNTISFFDPPITPG